MTTLCSVNSGSCLRNVHTQRCKVKRLLVLIKERSGRHGHVAQAPSALLVKDVLWIVDATWWWCGVVPLSIALVYIK